MSGERRLVRINETDIPVTFEAEGQITVGSERLHVEPAGIGSWRVQAADGLARLVHVVASQDEYWVHADGRVFLMSVGRSSGQRAAHRSSATGQLAAPMPSTVLSIVVRPGETVRAGDTVLILEAMKMELPVRAPRDGTVAAIHCREGDLVQPGVALAELA
jgi:3-methylcrotonyl-CoA carboxylase alpha subunit